MEPRTPKGGAGKVTLSGMPNKGAPNMRFFGKARANEARRAKLND